MITTMFKNRELSGPRQSFSDVEFKLQTMLDIVATVTNIEEVKIISKQGKRPVRDARNMFYYLTRYKRITLTNTAVFLKRDHTTIGYGATAFKNLMDTEAELKEQFERVLLILKACYEL